MLQQACIINLEFGKCRHKVIHNVHINKDKRKYKNKVKPKMPSAKG